MSTTPKRTLISNSGGFRELRNLRVPSKPRAFNEIVQIFRRGSLVTRIYGLASHGNSHPSSPVPETNASLYEENRVYIYIPIYRYKEGEPRRGRVRNACRFCKYSTWSLNAVRRKEDFPRHRAFFLLPSHIYSSHEPQTVIPRRGIIFAV